MSKDLGCKGGIVGCRRQCQMHLGGALPEQGSRIQILTHVFASQSERLFIREKTGVSTDRRRWRQACNAKIVFGELVKGPLPSISIILDQALQHGDSDRLAIFRIECDVTQEWGNTSEVGGLGEKSADLCIWIFAGLQAPKVL